MKILNGRELAEYIKQRQSREVRSLSQSRGICPKLSIIKTSDNPVIDSYVKLKQRYGSDIGVEVTISHLLMDDVKTVINEHNNDKNIHGIIIQLPLADESATGELLNLVTSNKDVDGLSEDSKFVPATALAIEWLIDGYNIDLASKNIAIVGRGRLVGGPLEKILIQRGLNVTVFDKGVGELNDLVDYDVVISATGQPSLIKSSMLKPGAVAIDAGVASDSGELHGDFEDGIYSRSDLMITPVKGGVGPLTVTALFENLLKAAKNI